MRQYFNYKTLGIIIIIGIIFWGVKNFLSSNYNRESSTNSNSSFIKSTKVKSDSSKSSERKTQNLPEISDEQESNQNPISQEIHVPILMYHHIAYYYGDKNDQLASLYVFPENFDKQMAYLKIAGYHIISLDKLYRGLQGLEKLPEKPIVITFDDGYDDNYQFAYPILKKYEMTATFFIITGKISSATYINWRQLRNLAKNGFGIGAHTVNHENLSALSSDLAKKEISKSKKDLELALDKKIRFFAYPFGDYNINLYKYLEENNFLAAVTTADGLVENGSKLYQLPRKRVDGRYIGLYGLSHFITLLK